MPPKKKPVRNAYYFFMESFKDDRNKQCPHDPITMKDAASLCSPIWQKMSPEEKKYYEDLAKKEKLQAKVDKFTTTGIELSVVENRERERQKYIQELKEKIENMVDSLNAVGILKKKFYFIHVNYFCQCDDENFLPAEVAVTCFSLEEGVHDFYHSMVAPGNLPIGYTFKAQKYSEETHGIPLPPSEIGEPDFEKMYRDIMEFVKRGSPGDETPILYTVGEFEPCVSDFLEKISNAAGKDKKMFKIYDLVHLFFNLKNKSASLYGHEGFPVLSLAETEIENDVFAFTNEICCYWHEGSEAPQYCSLSRARRWGFHICDHCCKDLPITMIPGQHLPSTHKFWDEIPVEGKGNSALDEEGASGWGVVGKLGSKNRSQPGKRIGANFKNLQ